MCKKQSSWVIETSLYGCCCVWHLPAIAKIHQQYTAEFVFVGQHSESQFACSWLTSTFLGWISCCSEGETGANGTIPGCLLQPEQQPFINYRGKSMANCHDTHSNSFLSTKSHSLHHLSPVRGRFTGSSSVCQRRQLRHRCEGVWVFLLCQSALLLKRLPYISA